MEKANLVGSIFRKVITIKKQVFNRNQLFTYLQNELFLSCEQLLIKCKIYLKMRTLNQYTVVDK